MAIGASFRDPDASLYIEGGRAVRAVRRESAEAFAGMLSDPFVQELLTSGRLIGTRKVDSATGSAADGRNVYYEHDLVPFVAYPNEWSPAMLARAAEFTLQLCLDLLARGYLLKDATPANILFNGGTPVFVDVPSIVPRPRGTYLWIAQDQFERTFLLPLVANAEAGVPVSWSLQDPARGLAHDAVARMLGLRRWTKPSLVNTVAVPAMLTRRVRTGPPLSLMRNDEQAVYVLEHKLRSNLKKVRRLQEAIRGNSRSMWQAYTRTRCHYSEGDISQKRIFVEEALREVRPAWVLDVGANTGEFSRLAAKWGKVVAIDSDEAAVNRIFLQSEDEQETILPIVADISRPTPASGWQNSESASLVERMRNRFDLVLMLAVIHHLRTTAGVPTVRILDLASELSTRHLLIEHVPISDPMFQRLSQGRDALYSDSERPSFENALERRFRVETKRELPNGRTLYLARKRSTD